MMELLVLSVAVAISLDLALGDPRSRYHPTAWMGTIIARIAPVGRTGRPLSEKLAGVGLVVSITAAAALATYLA